MGKEMKEKGKWERVRKVRKNEKIKKKKRIQLRASIVKTRIQKRFGQGGQRMV